MGRISRVKKTASNFQESLVTLGSNGNIKVIFLNQMRCFMRNSIL